MELLSNSFIFLIGSSIGSFLNVLIYRLPKNQSIVLPRSKCTSCNQIINWYDNIPILSWIILEGKCRYCEERISPSYLVVEILTGLSFVILSKSNSTIYDQLPNYQHIPISLILISIFIPLLILDLKYLWLPSSIIFFGISIGLIINFLYSYLFNNSQYLNHIFAGISGLVFFLLISIIGEKLLKKKVLGYGDAKLACLIGIWIGLEGLILSVYLSFLFSGVLCLILICFKIIKRNSKIPFGPFLIISTLIIWISGIDPIKDFFLNTHIM